MVVDLSDAVPFLTWFPWALADWLLAVLVISLAVTVIGWLFAAIRHGPIRAFSITGKVWSVGIGDLVSISPRRVSALSWLAVKESIRRRVVVVFAIFILVLLYAGWFLDPKSTNPALLYLSFVLTATSYLALVMALFLSALSLPADIKNRTIHTVVTKPVRMGEIVLGRIIGFMAVGTFLLVVMGLISYVFVIRGLAHTHELSADNLHPAEGSLAGQTPTLTGRTSYNHHHSHVVTISPSGKKARVEPEQGHTHSISVEKDGDKTVYKVGPEQEMLMARVPIYGKLSFRDRAGQPAEKGVSVGKEWTYRSYFEGGTLAAAVWTFQGITPEAFPDGLPVELNISVYRTYTGAITKGIPGSLSLCNPKTGKTVEVRIFSAKDYVLDSQFIPRRIISPKGEKLDLFKDFVDDKGEVEVWLRSVAPAQYFGAAQADMYLRAPDGYFTLNFIKGYIGIWLQMTLLIGMGVLFSTFLSGPVAILATAGVMLGGFFHQFLYEVAYQQTMTGGKVFGGGPFESMLRMITQDSITMDLDPNLRTMAVQTMDRLAEPLMRVAVMLVPDFGRFSFADYVAYGFNIPGDQILKYTFRMLAFVIPVFVAALFCLKTREVAQ
jgi:ABC-type transport system involved in multi-copper enzyme maturation permease subunit